jgi:hypothetical protein
MVLCAASGCFIGGARPTVEQLRRRASFDLDCEMSKLRYALIDEEIRGVSGCGRRVTYIVACDGPRENASTSCSWVVNGAIMESTPTRSAPVWSSVPAPLPASASMPAPAPAAGNPR